MRRKGTAPAFALDGDPADLNALAQISDEAGQADNQERFRIQGTLPFMRRGLTQSARGLSRPDDR